MLNTYNNIGTLTSSNCQMRALLEMFHQINLRIPSICFSLEMLENIIMDESCLMGNAHGHKYIRKSGKCLKSGSISVYYSEQSQYYVICCKPIVPTKILRQIAKNKIVVDDKIMYEIGKRYIIELYFAFATIYNDRKPVDRQLSSSIDNELKMIIRSIGYATNRWSDVNLSGTPSVSKYRQPLIMCMSTLYSTLISLCIDCGITSRVIFDPVYYHRYVNKMNEDMAFILSYVTERCILEGSHKSKLYQVRFCWDAIDRNLVGLNVIANNDQPYKMFHNTGFEELTPERVDRLVNLLIHLFYHEMGHIHFGFNNEEATDEWAKESRIQICKLLDFRYPEWRRVMRKVFINYALYYEESAMYN